MICAYKYYPIPYGVIDMGINGKIERIREKRSDGSVLRIPPAWRKGAAEELPEGTGLLLY